MTSRADTVEKKQTDTKNNHQEHLNVIRATSRLTNFAILAIERSTSITWSRKFMAALPRAITWFLPVLDAISGKASANYCQHLPH